jgi:Fe-S cluster biogenesis protein NfuA
MSAPTTTRPVDAERTGRRVEEVLDRLTADGDQAAAAAAEELVRSLMDFYGAGLARILHLLSSAPGEPSAGLLGDEVVASLLVLHDLHPEDRDTRIARALDSVGEHTLDVVDFDEESGTLRVRARAGGGCGCGSGADAREAVEAALACFAPEVKAVDVETAPAGPTLLQISTAPTGAR